MLQPAGSRLLPVAFRESQSCPESEGWTVSKASITNEQTVEDNGPGESLKPLRLFTKKARQSLTCRWRHSHLLRFIHRQHFQILIVKKKIARIGKRATAANRKHQPNQALGPRTIENPAPAIIAKTLTTVILGQYFV